MSSAAREEAIEIITQALVDQGSGTSIRPHVARAIDRLDETHAISRRPARQYALGGGNRPNAIERAMQGEPLVDTSRSYATGAPR